MKFRQLAMLGVCSAVVAISWSVPMQKVFGETVLKDMNETHKQLLLNPAQLKNATGKDNIAAAKLSGANASARMSSLPGQDLPYDIAFGGSDFKDDLVNYDGLSPEEYAELEKLYTDAGGTAMAMITEDLPTDNVGDDGILRSGLKAIANEVQLTINKAKLLDLKRPTSRVSISNPEIASAVIISGNQIQLVGNASGVTTLMIWDTENPDEYTVFDVIVQRDVSVLSKQLKMVDSRIGIQPMAAENSVILTGQTDSRERAQLAVEVARAYFSAAGGVASGDEGPSSLAPGSATPGSVPNIINLIEVAGKPSTKSQLLRDKLREIDPGINIDIVPGPTGEERVILTGRVRSADVVSKAVNTASIFYGAPGIRVVTGPGGNMVPEEAGSGDFHDATGFNSNINSNVLQGSIITDSTGTIVSMLEVTHRPQIKCKVKFLDVSRIALRQLGHNMMGTFNDLNVGHFSGVQSPLAGKGISTFDPNDSSHLIAETYNRLNDGSVTRTITKGFGIDSVFQDGVTQFIGINDTIGMAISALVEKRKARSLAEPTLTFLSGEKASFLAGGETPVPITGNNGQISVEFHEFGIRLNMTGTVKADGKIHLEVAPEVSSIDAANGITAANVVIPGFRTRRLQTSVELEPGQSLVIAGLFEQQEAESISRLPGAGRIPILGALFRNKNKDFRNNEMVVIIQPEVFMLPSNGVNPLYGTKPAVHRTAHKKNQKMSQEMIKSADKHSEPQKLGLK